MCCARVARTLSSLQRGVWRHADRARARVRGAVLAQRRPRFLPAAAGAGAGSGSGSGAPRFLPFFGDGAAAGSGSGSGAGSSSAAAALPFFPLPLAGAFPFGVAFFFSSGYASACFSAASSAAAFAEPSIPREEGEA